MLLRRPGVKQCVEQTWYTTGSLDNAAAVCNSGAIHSLVQLIRAKDSSEDTMLSCLVMLDNILAIKDHVAALLDTELANGLLQLLQLLQHTSQLIQEGATVALDKLANHSKPAQEQMSTAGAVEALTLRAAKCSSMAMRGAIRTLLELVNEDPANQATLVVAGGVGMLVQLFLARNTKDDVQLLHGGVLLYALLDVQQGKVKKPRCTTSCCWGCPGPDSSAGSRRYA